MDDSSSALPRAQEGITADSRPGSKTPPYSLGNTASLEAKRPETKSNLEWQEVNSATWRLVDPEGRQLRLEASHGQWGGYQYPKAFAYVFDVGGDKPDWRIRVRLRGNHWRAFGCTIDFATAKRIAQQAVENPAEPKPAKFSVPFNLVGGHRWGTQLDIQTAAHIQHIEVGAVKVDAPNEEPTASDDNKSINLCATDAEVDCQRLIDLEDTTMDEARLARSA